MCVCVCVCLGTHFQRIILDQGPVSQNPSGVKRVVFCTGKVYYELVRERKNRGMEDSVAIIRIEQVNALTHNTHTYAQHCT